MARKRMKEEFEVAEDVSKIASQGEDKPLEVKSNAEPNDEFLRGEYKEAAAAYFKGVDIGYNSIKNFLGLNALLVAAVNFSPSASERIAKNIAPLVTVMPWIGIALCAATAFGVGHYFNHLENCRMRCEVIERRFGGQLFTELGSISNKKWKLFSTSWAIYGIVSVIALGWAYIGYGMIKGG